MHLRPGQVVERYTVEQLLGEGGMAAVYRVRHNTLGTVHALKVLTVADVRVRDRLVLEGRVQARLRHPNVVTVTDVLDVEGAPGLLMECVDGGSLESALDVQRPPLPEAERLFRGILDGVAAAHALGFVHRDLKPSNVLLDRTVDPPVPKVTDFGLAKALESGTSSTQKTRSGLPMGTPSYMAPEQIRDARSVDVRADLFALGCILYELVTGKQAFDGPDLLSVLNSIGSCTYVPPRVLCPGLPARFEAAIRACIVSDRDRRVGSCAELSRILRGDLPLDDVGPASPEPSEEVTDPGRSRAPDGDLSLPPPMEETVLYDTGHRPAPQAAGEVDLTLPEPETRIQPRPPPPPQVRSPIVRTAMPQVRSNESILGLPSSPAASGGFLQVARWVVPAGITVAVLVGIAVVFRWTHVSPEQEIPSEPVTVLEPVVEPVPPPSLEEMPDATTSQDIPVSEPGPAPPSERTSVPSRVSPHVPTPGVPAMPKEVIPPPTPPKSPPPSPGASTKAPAAASWSWTGSGVTRVVLMDASGKRLRKGGVPPGAYAVMATFEGGSEVKAAHLKLVEGDNVVLECSPIRMDCRVQ